MNEWMNGSKQGIEQSLFNHFNYEFLETVRKELNDWLFD
jgi:hypothetical protein